MPREPFEMLERCHRRVEEEMRALVVEPARDVAERVLEFLDRAVKRHEDDEELSFFPRLPSLAPLAATLTAQHHDQQRLIEELRHAVDEKAIQVTALALEAAYARHITVEERDFIPAARALLDGDALAAISAEMQARRGR